MISILTHNTITSLSCRCHHRSQHRHPHGLSLCSAALNHCQLKDNVHLLSSILLYMHNLTLANNSVTLHWLPGYVDIAGNERADCTARLATSLPRVIFPLLASLSQVKSRANTASRALTRLALEDLVVQGSRSATWYTCATQMEPLIPPAQITQA